MAGKRGNPTGKGGFGDNPQNRANGRWTKETSIPYLQNVFGRMPIAEFEAYIPQTPFEQAAYNAVQKAKQNLAFLVEVTDRTSGKAQQHIDHTSDGDKIRIILPDAD